MDNRCRPHLHPTTDSWRVDDAYIRVRQQWKYLYRAVDSSDQTLDFMLSAKRNMNAAKRFLKKVLTARHTQIHGSSVWTNMPRIRLPLMSFKKGSDI